MKLFRKKEMAPAAQLKLDARMEMESIQFHVEYPKTDIDYCFGKDCLYVIDHTLKMALWIGRANPLYTMANSNGLIASKIALMLYAAAHPVREPWMDEAYKEYAYLVRQFIGGKNEH